MQNIVTLYDQTSMMVLFELDSVQQMIIICKINLLNYIT